MRYVGGKHRQAAKVAELIAQHRGDRTCYLEPFIGGGSVFARVAPTFDQATGADVVPDLVMLWQAGAAGWTPPIVTREAWAELRAAEPSALRGWAGYAGSFRGQWFAGYDPDRPKDRWASRVAGFRAQVGAIPDRAALVCCDYADHLVTASTVVYCDPPYAGTTGYHAVGAFDSDRFWRTAERWAATGALVLVHEYTAPAHWVPLHARARQAAIGGRSLSEASRVETLYAHPAALPSEFAPAA